METLQPGSLRTPPLRGTPPRPSPVLQAGGSVSPASLSPSRVTLGKWLEQAVWTSQGSLQTQLCHEGGPWRLVRWAVLEPLTEKGRPFGLRHLSDLSVPQLVDRHSAGSRRNAPRGLAACWWESWACWWESREVTQAGVPCLHNEGTLGWTCHGIPWVSVWERGRRCSRLHSCLWLPKGLFEMFGQRSRLPEELYFFFPLGKLFGAKSGHGEKEAGGLGEFGCFSVNRLDDGPASPFYWQWVLGFSGGSCHHMGVLWAQIVPWGLGVGP